MPEIIGLQMVTDLRFPPKLPFSSILGCLAALFNFLLVKISPLSLQSPCVDLGGPDGFQRGRNAADAGRSRCSQCAQELRRHQRWTRPAAACGVDDATEWLGWDAGSLEAQGDFDPSTKHTPWDSGSARWFCQLAVGLGGVLDHLPGTAADWNWSHWKCAAAYGVSFSWLGRAHFWPGDGSNTHGISFQLGQQRLALVQEAPVASGGLFLNHGKLPVKPEVWRVVSNSAGAGPRPTLNC